MDTGVADEDFANKTGSGHSTLLPIRGRGPTNPMTASPGRPTLGPLRLVVWCRLHRMTTGLCSDAGTYQMMLQLQCQTLVSTFHVNPLVCGIANKLWLRFLASTWVFASAWPDEVLAQSETTEFTKDLPTYLQDCRDVIFAGSFDSDEMEAEFIEKFWDFYQKNQEKTSGEEQAASPSDNSKAQESLPTAEC